MNVLLERNNDASETNDASRADNDASDVQRCVGQRMRQRRTMYPGRTMMRLKRTMMCQRNNDAS